MVRENPSSVKPDGTDITARPWGMLAPDERKAEMIRICGVLEERFDNEPTPTTLGEWWDSSDHLKTLAIFVCQILDPGSLPTFTKNE
jgi:hypothetical protein